MKVACPGCGKEYRAPVLAPGKGATVRCRACGSMFRLSAPTAAEPTAPPPPARPVAPTPVHAAAAPDPVPVSPPVAPAPPPAAPDPTPTSGLDSDFVFKVGTAKASKPAVDAGAELAPTAGGVLIADEARPFREALSVAVSDLGQSCELVEDGESALAYVQQHRPKLLLVNVYLRKMLGVVVCERVKADPQLRSTKVVLIGSLFRKDRFVRGPEHLYGADDYIEEAISPEDLKQRLGVLLGSAPDLAQPASSGAAPPSETPIPPEGKTASGETSVPEDVQRLIRIILSDIVLYNPDRLQAAMGNGQFLEEFKVELDEGRRLLVGRFPDLPQVEPAYAAAVERWLEDRRQAPVS